MDIRKNRRNIVRGWVVFSLLLLLSTALCAQSRGGDEFEAWKKKQDQAFSRYLSEEDRAFTGFLEAEAKLLDPEEAEEQDIKPKPLTPPVFTPPVPEPEVEPGASGKPDTDPEVELVPEESPEEVPEGEADRTPVVPDPAIPVPRDKQRAEFSFYGRDLTLHYPGSFIPGISGGINQKKIAAFWEQLASSDYEPLVRQCEDLRKKLRLNDWGYALLISRTGEKIYQGERNDATLFTWFILSKSGYSASLAFTSSRVHLLVKTEERLYGVPYFSFGGKEGTFYLLTLGERQELPTGSLYTYDRTFPGATRAFSFLMDRAPAIGTAVERKTYVFDYGGVRYKVPVEYNSRMVDYLEWYPQMEVEGHFLTAPSRGAADSLARSLTPIISGRGEAEAANMLIRFVQTAFKYETDQEQFDREKLMNADEILHYNRSDCDDRSIFYTYLVRTLLGLKTAGLDYPGHLATAIRLNDVTEGDAVDVEGQRYLVCDPTYINADIGREMPTVRGRLIRAFPVGEKR